MRFHYDLSQAEPIIRDEAVVGTSDIQLGAVVGREGAITTAENRMGLQASTASDLIGVVGVANEFYDYSAHISNTGSNAATAAATGVTNYIKVIINPLAVWMAEWSQNADNDSVNTTASTTGKVITDTVVTDMEGDWVYITNTASSVGGYGNLFQIGASTSTTSITATTSFDDNLKANAASDTYIHIIAPWNGGDTAAETINLSAATGEVGTKIFSLIEDPSTGAATILANYIESSTTGVEPLRVENHGGRNYPGAKFYADIHFSEHVLLGNYLTIT